MHHDIMTSLARVDENVPGLISSFLVLVYFSITALLANQIRLFCCTLCSVFVYHNYRPDNPFIPGHSPVNAPRRAARWSHRREQGLGIEPFSQHSKVFFI